MTELKPTTPEGAINLLAQKLACEEYAMGHFSHRQGEPSKFERADTGEVATKISMMLAAMGWKLSPS